MTGLGLGLRNGNRDSIRLGPFWATLTTDASACCACGPGEPGTVVPPRGVVTSVAAGRPEPNITTKPMIIGTRVSAAGDHAPHEMESRDSTE